LEVELLESSLKALLSILAALALIGVNALWVASEFAIVRVRRTRLEELAGQGVETAKSAIVIVDRISDYLALTQIGITVASLAVGWLAEDAVVQLLRLLHPAADQAGKPYHAVAIPAAFLVVTVLHVVLGEQVPKLLAVRSAERYLLVLARPLRIAHFILKPFLRLLERASAWILRHMGHGVATHAPHTEEELKLILAESHRGGILSDAEAEIIVRAFEIFGYGSGGNHDPCRAGLIHLARADAGAESWLGDRAHARSFARLPQRARYRRRDGQHEGCLAASRAQPVERRVRACVPAGDYHSN
jgi:hypothetical protein